jgi:hypothetical protein
MLHVGSVLQRAPMRFRSMDQSKAGWEPLRHTVLEVSIWQQALVAPVFT